jgi:hypothetical protein
VELLFLELLRRTTKAASTYSKQLYRRGALKKNGRKIGLRGNKLCRADVNAADGSREPKRACIACDDSSLLPHGSSVASNLHDVPSLFLSICERQSSGGGGTGGLLKSGRNVLVDVAAGRAQSPPCPPGCPASDPARTEAPPGL